MAIETKFAISAFIDLLGFSNHLALANNDTRTVIGEMAIKRLTNLENVLKFIKQEEKKFKNCYPNIEISRQRFNDAIFFTMELSTVIQPEIGQHNWQGLGTSSLTEWAKQMDIPAQKKVAAATDELFTQSHNAAKFLGLIARVHGKINTLELNDNFPGARTVVCTGNKVIDRENNITDPFSANFSISNAYIVGELGTKGGFGGNNFYVDDNVARIISLNKLHIPLLYLSNIIAKRKDNDPYKIDATSVSRISSSRGWKFTEARQIKTILFNKEYSFRELNIAPLSWIQVRHYIEEEVGVGVFLKNDPDGYRRIIVNLFNDKTVLMDDIKKNPFGKSMFLLSQVTLGKNYFRENF